MIEKRTEFANSMRREHRTIQQLNAVPIFEVIQQWADDYSSGNYDLRNEATCKLAYTLVEKFQHQANEEMRDLFASLNFPYI